MKFDFRRDWDSEDWERFARRLVQGRHGAQNVQTVPDTVRGDAGIEYFTTDGCCYQSYAPEQSSDTKKAASAMKRKASRDLSKLRENESTIAGLLGAQKLTRWILLCPFLDDKSVISHIRTKASSLAISDLSFVGGEFHPLVQSQHDFETELQVLRARSLGIPIDVQDPSDERTSIHNEELGTQIDAKLMRGFPALRSERRRELVWNHVRAHLMCADTLDQLKQEYPDIWESYRRALKIEEVRLETAGPSSQEASAQISQERERLEFQLSIVLPSLDRMAITALASGTVSTWLIECPLDFEWSSC